MRARDFVADEVVRAAADETLQAVARRMRACGVGAVLVYEGARLAGIITERDVVTAVAEGLPATAAVGRAMTPDPVCAAPDEDVAEVALRMMQLGVHHLPVADAGRVIGMVSAGDLITFQASCALRAAPRARA